MPGPGGVPVSGGDLVPVECLVPGGSGPSMPCRFQGPHPRGKLRWMGPGGVSRPTPKGELSGIWSRPTPKGKLREMHTKNK